MAYNIPSGASSYNGHNYYVYQGGTCHSWEEAVNYCTSQGGHMAVINDDAENAFLYQFMKDSGYSNAYFGLTDIGHEGTWNWVNGDSSMYRNWSPGEPSNSGEHYAMFYAGAQEKHWNDGTFGAYYGDADRTFICEWENAPQPTGKSYDIVFIVDKSGSMGGYINQVKNNISSFVTTLRNNGVDVQLGLVEYEGSQNIKKYDMTDNVDAFISNVDSIRTIGSSEYGLSAIADASNGALSLNLRENSNREFILITDEDYDDEGIHSVADVTTKLNNNNVKLDVFGEKDSGYYRGCEDRWTPVANATSGYLINGESVQGQFYDITSDFSTLFKAAIIDGRVDSTTGTHQLSFAHWGYGYTPASDAAALSTDPASSVVVAPTA